MQKWPDETMNWPEGSLEAEIESWFSTKDDPEPSPDFLEPFHDETSADFLREPDLPEFTGKFISAGAKMRTLWAGDQFDTQFPDPKVKCNDLRQRLTNFGPFAEAGDQDVARKVLVQKELRLLLKAPEMTERPSQELQTDMQIYMLEMS